jgi:hypothetical protein
MCCRRRHETSRAMRSGVDKRLGYLGEWHVPSWRRPQRDRSRRPSDLEVRGNVKELSPSSRAREAKAREAEADVGRPPFSIGVCIDGQAGVPDSDLAPASG